ncbi:alpha/beta hydrolase [Pyxidicoccus fallax]|uniref:Alpha/beta hydrolase n=1 Tax=Pyxidicoccus fallax TaxID=394095 RepID=A0A848LAP3_9BACT|nr:alpha/beta hydrolase [Pyxidicoccus fallax]NMO15687.1 alpha/beta hydrolase [Pyxidicoccus fallax]NPC77094.1 alpha/beta hydrolase [Pyxidicoccus fallax]
MSTFTTADGCRLDYHLAGSITSERTLVLLHGWSQSRAMFDRVIPMLARHYRVVSYDQRGHGESGRPPHGARIARLARDLDELLTHLQIEQADFAGHSMGASVLWSYLDLFGSAKVSSLVIIDQPSACTLLPWLDKASASEVGAIVDFSGAEAFCKGFMGPDAASVRHQFLASMLTRRIPAEDLAWLYQENLKLDGGFGSRLLLDHLMQDWRDVLPRIDVPTLVLAGEVSHVNPASQKWSAEHIPGARLHVFTAEEGGAHFPFFERPETFAVALRSFLDAQPAPRARARTVS